MGRFFRVTCISDQMISILDTEFDFFLSSSSIGIALAYIIEDKFNIQSQNQSHFFFKNWKCEDKEVDK